MISQNSTNGYERSRILLLFTLLIIIASCTAIRKDDPGVSGGQAASAESGTIVLDEIGAKGDGVFDNSEIIQSALLTPGVEMIVFGEGVYFIGSPIIVQSENISFVGSGVESTKLLGSNTQLIKVNNVPVLTIDYDRHISASDSLLYFGQASMLDTGQVVHVSSTEGMQESASGGYTKHFCSRIIDVQENTIELEQTSEIPFSQNIKLDVYSAAKFVMSGMTLESSKTMYLVTLSNLLDVDISNVNFVGRDKVFMGEYLSNPSRGTSAIATYACHNVRVDSCKFFYIWYGLMAHKGCVDVMLTNSEATECRHINNNGVGTRRFVVSHCTAYSCNGGFDSHETALYTAIKNCHDVTPRGISKFRGRRDNIDQSQFDGDLEFRTDPGLYSNASDSLFVNKKMSNCIVRGNTILSAANVSVQNTMFYGSVHPFKNIGMLRIANSIIDVSDSNDAQTAALTIADGAAPSGEYQFELKDVEIIGPGVESLSAFTSGIYLPMKEGASGEIHNLTIRGFEKGMVLYGASIRYVNERGLKASNITLTDCNYAVYRQGDSKHAIELENVTIQNCNYSQNPESSIAIFPDN